MGNVKFLLPTLIFFLF